MLDKIITIACAVFGIVWAYLGWFKYGFWVNNGVGGGFLPVVIGLFTTACCLPLILRDFMPAKKTSADKTPEEIAKDKKNKENEYYRPLLCVAGLLITVLLIPYLGMILSLFLYLTFWLFFIEKIKIMRVLPISFGMMLIVYCVFILWLNVPFPQGFLQI